MACYQSHIRNHVVARLSAHGMAPQLARAWAAMVVSELNTPITDPPDRGATATTYVRAAERLWTTVLQGHGTAATHAAAVLTHNGMSPARALAILTAGEPDPFAQPRTPPQSRRAQLPQRDRFPPAPDPAAQLRADAHVVIEKCQQFANAERVAAWAEVSAVLMRSVAHGPGLTGAPLDVRLQEAINTMMLALLWTYPNARTTPNGLAALIAIPPDLRNELAPMVGDLVDYGLTRIQLADETIIQICQAVMNTRKAGGGAAPDRGGPTRRWTSGARISTAIRTGMFTGFGSMPSTPLIQASSNGCATYPT